MKYQHSKYDAIPYPPPPKKKKNKKNKKKIIITERRKERKEKKGKQNKTTTTKTKTTTFSPVSPALGQTLDILSITKSANAWTERDDAPNNITQWRRQSIKSQLSN